MNIFILQMDTKTLIITDKSFIHKKTGIRQKREMSKKWKHIEQRDYSQEEQIDILMGCLSGSLLGIHRETLQQLRYKLKSYAGQDDKHYLSENKDTKHQTFNKIIREDVKTCDVEINKMNLDDLLKVLIESKLQCYYCENPVKIIYHYVRDNEQWTLDRVNNSKDHTKDNCVICCLKCNLERRCLDNTRFYIGKHIQCTKSVKCET
jgi:hypothetical protein